MAGQLSPLYPDTTTYGARQEFLIWTDPNRAGAEWNSSVYAIRAALLGMNTISSLAIGTVFPKAGLGTTTSSDIAIAMFISCYYGSMALFRIVAYFGIPPYLTFEVQISKILPTSCAASIPIEGPDGWPCYLKKIREEWIGFVNSDGSYHFGEAEREVVGMCMIGLLLGGALLLSVVALRRRRLRREAHTRRDDNSEKTTVG